MPSGEPDSPEYVQLAGHNGGGGQDRAVRRAKWKAETMLNMAISDKADISRITVVPGQRSGQPCIRGLRVTVWDVLDMLASGMSETEILEDYPYLEKADFPAVYAYASQSGRERVSH